MSAQDVQTAALVLLFVFQAITGWALVAARSEVRQLRATIPPDLSSKYQAVHDSCEVLERRADLTDETLDTFVKTFQAMGTALQAVGRVTMKRWL